MGQNYWPGLKAFELSWIWLELLQGLNHKSSFGYDYSWLFSKIHTFALDSNPSEIRRTLAVTPFLFVKGDDPIGSTILCNEIIKRSGGVHWTPWLWGGYHAFENLKDKHLASQYFLQAAKFSTAPEYVAKLAYRLHQSYSQNLTSLEKEAFVRELPQSIQNKIRSK
jgi:hypothetical protein